MHPCRMPIHNTRDIPCIHKHAQRAVNRDQDCNMAKISHKHLVASQRCLGSQYLWLHTPELRKLTTVKDTGTSVYPGGSKLCSLNCPNNWYRIDLQACIKVWTCTVRFVQFKRFTKVLDEMRWLIYCPTHLKFFTLEASGSISESDVKFITRLSAFNFCRNI